MLDKFGIKSVQDIESKRIFLNCIVFNIYVHEIIFYIICTKTEHKRNDKNE